VLRLFAAAAVLAAGLLVSSCDMLSGAHSYRYRVTVEVETPQGLRSGSSVWEVKAHQGGGLDPRLIIQVHAEAVPVEVPGGILFAVLRAQDVNAAGQYAWGVVQTHLAEHPSAGVAMTSNWAENTRRIAIAKPSFDLSPSEYPLLVRFRDLSDPASVERIDAGDLSETLGGGTRLKRIAVAVTSEGPRDELEHYLPWLKRHRGALARCRGTPILEQPLKCRLTNGDLQRDDS